VKWRNFKQKNEKTYFIGDTIIITIIMSRMKPALCPGTTWIGVDKGVKQETNRAE
jgi:hypothetical protein